MTIGGFASLQFGEVWSRETELPAKMRSIVTISALISIRRQ